MSTDDVLNDFLAGNQNDKNGLGTVYGESGMPHGLFKFSPYIAQYYSDTCAIRSQQIILRDYGINISQDQLIDLAEDHGWYEKGEGTPTADVGKLMDLVGVDCHQSSNNSIYDLVSELSQGHRIIVSVDSGELWADTFSEALDERFEDMSGIKGADHALIVAGVEVNPFNSDDVKVVLTDPGTGELRVEYSLEDFMDAWKDSDCFMVTTEDPAPYQFDPTTGMEMPSGFSTDYELSSFATDNGFFLADDDIGTLDDYSPAYSEVHHIEIPEFLDDMDLNGDTDFLSDTHDLDMDLDLDADTDIDFDTL